MENTNNTAVDGRAMGELNVVFGSGGSKAILAGAGAALAFQLSGLKTFRTIGGVSGGSIPAALLSAGMDAPTLISLALQTDFSRFLTARRGKLFQILALLSKYRYEMTKPSRGVFSSELLGDFIDKNVTGWPEKFWTIAATREGGMLFSKQGVHLKSPGGARPMLASATPPQAGIAVRASCAIPGVIDAMHLYGEDLFDGALTDDGECPVDVPVNHFGAQKSDVIAIDISEEIIKKKRWLRILWHIFCGGKCASIDAVHPEEKDGLILVKPEIIGFHALEFSLSREQKWHAIAASFVATVDALERHGRLSEPHRSDVLKLRHHLAALDYRKLRKKGYGARVQALISASTPHNLLVGSKGGHP